MSVWSAENELKRARAALEDARKRQAAEEKKASDAEKTAANRIQSARRTSSPSSAQSYLREADRRTRDAQTARARAAEFSAKVAAAQTKVHQAESRLARAQADDEKKREADRRRQQQAADRAARQAERDREREDQARREADAARDQQIAVLEAELAQAQAKLDSRPWEDAPERITVLFLASEPDGVTHLRVDREVREIQDRVRSSKMRDSIAFEYRPAVRVTDLLHHLNEVEPDIVHFSGHGADSGIALHDAADQVRLVSNADLSALLLTAPKRLKLAVFNSCNSAEQARIATDYVDAAIGMETSIEDESARVFAGRLYNSLGFGRPLSLAFEQARLQVQFTFDAVSGDPTLHTAAGVDPREVVLVAPG